MKTTKDKKFKSNRFLPNLKHAIACLDGGDYATGAEYLETAIALCGDDDGKKLCKMALYDARQEREESLRLCKMAFNVVCYNSAEWCDDAELRDAGLELLAMGKPDTASHTPGPWKHDKDCKGGFIIYQHGPSLGKTGNAEDCPVVAQTLGGNESNARLIAAAPELLTSLESLLQFVEIGEGRKANDFEQVLKARAIIATAKGGK